MKQKSRRLIASISLPAVYCISIFLQAEVLTKVQVQAKVQGETQYFESKAQQVNLIELFTSEGCSSCPTADAWLSAWEDDKRLWRDVVPVAFHVDYWNYLGWQDELARPAYSTRQRLHKQTGNVQSVYTPSLVINGGEWRGFFNPLTRQQPPMADKEVGVLKLTSRPPELMLEFSHANQTLTANYVFLTHNLDQPIRAGENKGKTLHHDFAVLAHVQQPARTGNAWLIEAEMPEGTTAIAAWLAHPVTLKPVQAVGGWLRMDTTLPE